MPSTAVLSVFECRSSKTPGATSALYRGLGFGDAALSSVQVTEYLGVPAVGKAS